MVCVLGVLYHFYDTVVASLMRAASVLLPICSAAGPWQLCRGSHIVASFHC